MEKQILKKIKILYVEDEEEVRTLTVKVLSQLVEEIVEATNGKEGLDKFKEHLDPSNDLKPFDIIVTDINMPKMDGLEMLEQINQLVKDVPSIITTAHSDSDFLKQAINLRVRGYVNKPLNLHDLIDSIVIAVEPQFLRNELINANKNLEAEVEEKTLELRSILDCQNSMIVVYNEDQITMANRTFLDFFQIESLVQLMSHPVKLCEKFLKKPNYYNCTNEQNWIQVILHLEKIDRIVIMKDPQDNDRIFEVNITSFNYGTFHYVVSFNDITELKRYTYELQYKATHDNLTQLYNRQKFGDDLQNEIARVQRYGHQLSVVMFDIDDFKMINDTYGHDIGDIVLKEVSEIVVKSIRKTDLAARWGGEEFMILLPETRLDGAKIIAENIRKGISEHHFSQLEKTVTISLGVELFKEGYDKDKLLKNVDVALYEAKKRGKNQVVAYEK
ncbi:MAG: diguanylate cyclase [Campylobacterales bacterium]|nr:diguanylate cyclase [Campylobacterales bacterium]